MRIDPAIVALRSDRASQRRCAKAMEQARVRWLADEAVGGVIRDLAAFGAGEDLERLASLERIVTRHASAQRFLAAWVSEFISALKSENLAQIPFRHSYARGFATLQLAQFGRATLSLVAYEATRNKRDPQSAVFVDREQHEIVVSGGVTGLFCHLNGAGVSDRVECERLVLGVGDTVVCRDYFASRQVSEVGSHLVMLQLTRASSNPRPTREIALEDGRLLRQACGSKRTSQREMALAVLGAMDRKDAAAAMRAIATDTGEPDHLRWEAQRQLLGIETALGIQSLGEIAQREADPLTVPASRLHEQLLARHPELARVEVDACPA